MTCDLEGSSNLVSTCNCGGVLAGSLVAEFVVCVVTMVIINLCIIRVWSVGYDVDVYIFQLQ